ncbi:hypothetical protein [Methanoculleus chikugoensis]|uniref:hypothetical protein n=1 Tax=Methanoculleus chikugoensis TaxID=118126 RepID=UPI0015B8380B|nr:hypothetical protein [Methanoculleus chikugoensis]
MSVAEPKPVLLRSGTAVMRVSGRGSFAASLNVIVEPGPKTLMLPSVSALRRNVASQV